MLIAETDGAGSVEWVWVYRDARRRSRPVKPAIDRFDTIEDIEVTGAPKAAVAKWLIDKDCLRRAR